MRSEQSGRRSRSEGPLGAPILGHTITGSGVRYDVSGDTAIKGDPSGFYVAALFAFFTGDSSSYIAHNRAGSTDGWRLWLSAASTLSFSQTDGGGVLRNSPTYTITPIIGKVISAVGVYDSAKARLYVNGMQLGDGTSLTGYTEPTDTTCAFHIGLGAAGQNSVFFGCLGGAGIPSAANIAAWSEGCKAARTLVTMPGVAPEHLWKPLDPPANIADGVGSTTLTKIGTPVAVTLRQWGY